MFRTEVSIDPGDISITHTSPILTLGSCFSTGMGERFQENKFDVLSNPFGTVYNPASIHRLLRFSLKLEEVRKDLLTEHQGIWHHYDAHSSFGSTDREQVWEQFNQQIGKVGRFLEKAEVLILTYGSAFVFELKENNHLVTNCHKQPAIRFTKRLLTLEEIVRELRELVTALRSIRPQIKCILTVSPVRHLRETLPGNQLSKSILRLATDQASRTLTNVEYFPAYELVLDDLRDYRFFQEDMIHPTRVAENYVWEKFAEAYFSPDTRQLTEKWADIRRALYHRPAQPESEAHRKFLKDLLDRMERFSGLDLNAEIRQLRDQLTLQRKP